MKMSGENTQNKADVSSNPAKINNLEELKQSTLELFRESKQLIQIFSFSLDKRILSNREIELTLTKLIRSNRNAKIQCLIFDEKELQGHDHRLVALAQRFTSFIEIRAIPEELHNTISNYYLIDKQLMIYRTNRERFEAQWFKKRHIEVKDKAKHFDEVWQQSRQASFLRALFL